MDVPETRYTRSGDVSIAYQVVGDGPFDVVLMPAFSHVELAWTHPRPPRPGAAAGSSEFARLIFFDRRGMGMSDRVTGRVARDADGRRPRGHGRGRLEAGRALRDVRGRGDEPRSSPPRTRSGRARSSCSPVAPDDVGARLPLGTDRGEASAMRGLFMQLFFGSRQEALEVARLWRGPGLGDDELFEDIDYLRRAAGSPRTMEAYQAMIREIDVRQVLPGIRVPTLLIHGAEASPFSVDGARYMARADSSGAAARAAGRADAPGGRRPPARARRSRRRSSRTPGRRGAWEEPEPDRVLATVLFTDIVGSTRARGRARRPRLARAARAPPRARPARSSCASAARRWTPPATASSPRFDGPARAIRCAGRSSRACRELGLEVRAGLHTGECELIDGKVAGIAVHIGARVASHAEPGEVLVSSTVKDLVAGSGLAFEDRGAHELKGVPGEWRLYAVER